MRRNALAVVPATIALLAPSAAPAAQRYASPESERFLGDCPSSSPCRIDHAVENAANGDEVIVLPGTYELGGALEVVDRSIDIHGVAGRPRPRVVGPSGGRTLTLDPAAGAPVRVSHLLLERTGGFGAVLELRDGGAELFDLVLHGQGDSVHTAELGPTADRVVLRDSIVRMAGGGVGAAIVGRGKDIQLRNVTAIAANESQAIRATEYCPPTPPFGGCGAGAGHGRITARNVIARGGGVDLVATSGGSSQYAGTLAIAHSNFARVWANSGGSVVDEGGNQSAPPLFANPAQGDFHQLSTSPTIDAGTADPLNGSADIDGDARTIGAAPDIGADESTFPRASQESPREPPPSDPLQPPPVFDPSLRDLIGPRLGRLTLRPRTPRTGRRARLLFTLDEAAAVRIAIRRGRRTIRRATARGKSGANAVRLPRLRRAGRYSLRVRARDEAGNASALRRLTFRVRYLRPR